MRIDDRILDLPPEEGARVVALGLLSEALAAAAALAAGRGDEPLHDFRVAVRRLRSALRTYRPWLAGAVRRKHAKRLRRLARSTNSARDAEVQLAWLAARRDALSPRHLPGHAVAVARFGARLRRGPDPARLAARFGRSAAKLRQRLERPERRLPLFAAEGPTFGAVLASLVEDQVDAFVARLERVRDAGDVARAHRARIDGKRLRYLMEPLRGHPRADASDVVRGLKRLQDVLGELHDAHVLGEELGAALVEAAADRARILHAAALSTSDAGGDLREGLRASPRSGLLALLRLVRERRDASFADLEGVRLRAGGLAAIVAQARGVAAALVAPAGGRPRPRGGRSRDAVLGGEPLARSGDVAGVSHDDGRRRAHLPVRRARRRSGQRSAEERRREAGEARTVTSRAFT